MKKIDFINHPEYFHEDKFLNNSSNYFEGWYFKISNGIDVISFIPGINIENRKLFFFYTNYYKRKFLFFKLFFSRFFF